MLSMEAMSLAAEETTPLSAIDEFGANCYTGGEERTIFEIIDKFNQRHGIELTKEDFLRFEQVNRDILDDENLKDMLKNTPPMWPVVHFHRHSLRELYACFNAIINFKTS